MKEKETKESGRKESNPFFSEEAMKNPPGKNETGSSEKNDRKKESPPSEEKEKSHGSVRESALDHAMDEWRRKGSERKDYDKVSLSEQGFVPNIPYGKGREKVTGEQIRQDIQNGIIKQKRMHTNSLSKVIRQEEIFADQVSKISYQTQSDGTSMGQGVRFASENVMPFANVAIGSMRQSMAYSMRVGLNGDERFQRALSEVLKIKDENGKQIIKIKNPQNLTEKDIKRLSEGTALIFKQAGITKLNKDPVKARMQIDKAILTGRINGAQAKALVRVAKEADRIASVDVKKPKVLGKETGLLKGSGIKFTTRKIARYANQEETGRAILMTGKLAQLSVPVIRQYLKIFGFMTRVARIATKKAAKASVVLSINLARSRLVTTVTPKPVKKAASKAVGGGRKVTGAVRTGKETAGSMVRGVYQRITDPFQRISKWRKKTFAPVNKAGKMAGKIVKLPFMGRFNPLRLLGKLLSALLYAKEVIISIVATIVLIIIIMIIVSGVIAAVTNAINFNAKDEKAQKLIFDTIDTCYQEQLSVLSGYSMGDYDHVSIEEVEKKSNSAYEEEKDFPYTETTNSTELISMAIIYFEGDLDQYADQGMTSANPLVKYIKGMYYGSHDIDVIPEDEGVRIKVTTYYFDDLFECEPKDGFSDYSMKDGTGQLKKIKVKVASMGQVKCSAYGHPDIDSLGGAPEPNSVAYYTAALLRGDMEILKKFGIRQGSFIVLKIPDGAFPKAGISGNLVYKIGSSGSYGSGRVFDLYFDHEKSDMNHFGVRTLSGYVPNGSGSEIIEAWVVDNGEIDKIPGLISVEEEDSGDASIKAKQLLEYCDRIGAYISENNTKFYNKAYDGGGGRSRFSGNFNRLKTMISQGKSYNIDCVVIREIALKSMGISLSSGKKITSAHGKNIQKAVEDHNLVPGDIIMYSESFSGLSHSVVYKGSDDSGAIYVYETGGECRKLSPKYSNHCLINYKNRYRSYKIDYVRRLE